MYDELSPVEVFAGSEIEAAIVMHLLDNEQIESWLWNEVLGSRQSVPIHVSVTVVVQKKNELKAKTIVSEYLEKT